MPSKASSIRKKLHLFFSSKRGHGPITERRWTLIPDPAIWVSIRPISHTSIGSLYIPIWPKGFGCRVVSYWFDSHTAQWLRANFKVPFDKMCCQMVIPGTDTFASDYGSYLYLTSKCGNFSENNKPRFAGKPQRRRKSSLKSTQSKAVKRTIYSTLMDYVSFKARNTLANTFTLTLNV